MQSPVVAVCAGYTRNAMASRAVPDAWVQHDLLMEEQ